MLSVATYKPFQPDFQFMDKTSSLHTTINNILNRDPYIGNTHPNLRLSLNHSSSVTPTTPQTPDEPSFEETMSLDSINGTFGDLGFGIFGDINISTIEVCEASDPGPDIFGQEELIKTEGKSEMTPSQTSSSTTSSSSSPPRDEHVENTPAVEVKNIQRKKEKTKNTEMKKVELRQSPRAFYQTMINSNRKSKRGGKRQLRLWEFIRGLLESKESPRHIAWVSREEGTFRLLNSGAVANLWGETKNRTDMTYEKMSRAMRYYYAKKILQPIPQKLTYKFGDKILQEMN